ncbi:hypothetical protein PQ455_04205 [Sphingomonas naphthae]|uniref:MFS transporter n=1 Tax=Sphingomonas naphthae TaxID=1813468 RepID=A0ABY7TP11_9SPHN|nr:hypothetical protein [Sphingomonas naphthae]WCT74441.1 hypothetical protein PQ455_04205 [Sphingomonas naphthae]
MAKLDLSEFRQNWRPLTACFLGVGSALSLNNFVASNFAPYLIKEFAWTRAQWAMTGTVVLLIFVCVPIAGRLADLYGVRRVASVGVVSFPLSYVAIALMNGDIRIFYAICILQVVLRNGGIRISAATPQTAEKVATAA